MEKEFHGIIPPAITPLTARNGVDVAGLERLLGRMLSGGVHGLFILGTTGEGPALGRQAQETMIGETLRIAAGRVPVLTGISGASFRDSVELAAFARRAGAAAAVAAPPCYFSLGEAELVDYYRALAAEINFPLFVYNMPSMTKVYLRPALVRELAAIPGIRGYKDSSANMPDFHEVLLSLKDRRDFSIFMGPEELLGEAVLFGADGGVSGGANLMPETFVAMYEAARRGDVPQMLLYQKKIYEQRRLYSLGHYQSSMIKGLKSALKSLGVCEDFMVKPFNHFERADADAVRSVLCGIQNCRPAAETAEGRIFSR